jgi:cytochrome d ubiquinol oxidase subunit II
VETCLLGHLAQTAYLVLAVVGLVLGRSVPHVDVTAPPTLALLGATVVLAAIYVGASRRGRHYIAFAAVAGQVYGLVALVATLLYPSIDPAAGLTAEAAIVSTLPLNLTSIGTALLLPLVAVYFVVLYSAFDGPVVDSDAYS